MLFLSRQSLLAWNHYNSLRGTTFSYLLALQVSFEFPGLWVCAQACWWLSSFSSPTMLSLNLFYCWTHEWRSSMGICLFTWMSFAVTSTEIAYISLQPLRRIWGTIVLSFICVQCEYPGHIFSPPPKKMGPIRNPSGTSTSRVRVWVIAVM